MPKVDMDMESGKIAAWHVAQGGAVEKGAALFDIETSKAAMEVEAPATGILHHVIAEIDDVIAVAGCNEQRKPWKGTCRGGSVDVTAPGELVWKAQFNPETGAADIDGGQGTSFAVALTAGVDGDPLTPTGSADGTLDVSAAVTDHVCAYAGDISDKEIICDFPF